MADKTQKPEGGSIVRNGYHFTCSWKIKDTDHGDGQQFEYQFLSANPSKVSQNTWNKADVSKSATSIKLKPSSNVFFPENKSGVHLETVKFRVRGNRKAYKKGSGKNEKTYNPGWSDWYTKTLTLSDPPKPTLSSSLVASNQCNFTYKVSGDDKDNKPFSWVEWDSVLVKDNSTTDGSKITFSSTKSGYKSGTNKKRTDTIPIKEESDVTENKDSHTRWIRIRSVGTAGYSPYTYARHTYSNPSPAKDVSASVKEDGSSLRVTESWTASSNNKNNPIDSVKVQYAITVPEAGLTYNGSSWTDADYDGRDTSGKDKAQFTIGQHLGEDECLFTRVVTKHDDNTTYSASVLAKVGTMKEPTLSNASPNYDTYSSVSVTATNNSSVPGSYLKVYLKRKSAPSSPEYLGKATSGRATILSCNSFEGEESISIGVQAYIEGNGKTMQSPIVWDASNIPIAPTNVTVTEVEGKEGTVLVSWDWTWQDATGCELSWADHDDAWMSTDEPSTYTVSKMRAAQWYITGLEEGKEWYVRVRLMQETEDGVLYGAYSDTKSIDLSSAPDVPVLDVEPGILSNRGEFTCSWTYISTDSTYQSYAEIRQVEIVGGEVVLGEVVATEQTAQHTTLSVADLGWQTGKTYLLAVRVTSGSDHLSDWSTPMPITIADPIYCSISTGTGFKTITLVEDDETGETRQQDSLVSFPFTFSVSGAGEDGKTTVSIERAADYTMARPDESTSFGYEGEMVWKSVDTGDNTYIVNVEDVQGYLDDGAAYLIRAMVEDGIGQTDMQVYPFEVHWDHQAQIPSAEVEVDSTNLISKITPIAPGTVKAGDTCDIYRLSADKPVLIVQNGEFGHAYVDQYPALGEFGGHRIVYKTLYGDYITADNVVAFYDVTADDGDTIETEYAAIIDFDDKRINLLYNVDIQNTWKKDFRETKYLGGSIQGDWNRGVSRTGSISAVAITITDAETIELFRRLAVYTGICHVRTKDGSSYSADIQVTEDYSHSTGHMVATFGLTITRVDDVELGGITFEEWFARMLDIDGQALLYSGTDVSIDFALDASGRLLYSNTGTADLDLEVQDGHLTLGG